MAGETAARLGPARPSLTSLNETAAGCTACPLHETGTQTVFGEGLVRAEILFAASSRAIARPLASTAGSPT